MRQELRSCQRNGCRIFGIQKAINNAFSDVEQGLIVLRDLRIYGVGGGFASKLGRCLDGCAEFLKAIAKRYTTHLHFRAIRVRNIVTRHENSLAHALAASGINKMNMHYE